MSEPHARATVRLVYATHRPETLPRAEAAMRGCGLVILEEPTTPGFEAMLEGALDPEEYLLQTEFEYPAFARRAARMQQRLHAEGARLLQLDPFMDELYAIHEFFIAGGAPADIEPATLRADVYEAERLWSKALLDYYSVAAADDLDALTEALLDFAFADAARGLLRDRLRAEAIAETLAEAAREHHLPARVCVEAGVIHFALLKELVTRLARQTEFTASVEVVHLMEDVSRRLLGRRRILAPGDVLTLLATTRPDRPRGSRERRLAAQSLVHAKIQHKEEMEETTEQPFPHTMDEAWSASLAFHLDEKHSRRLYPAIASLPTPRARAHAERYAASLGWTPPV